MCARERERETGVGLVMDAEEMRVEDVLRQGVPELVRRYVCVCVCVCVCVSICVYTHDNYFLQTNDSIEKTIFFKKSAKPRNILPVA